MCQIISVPAGKEVDLDKLDKAQEHNEDGYGVAWYEDKVVKTYKTMDYDVFKHIVSGLTKFTKIVHLRYNTVGQTTLENCHPFPVPNGVMFHNGTIPSLKPAGSWDKKQKKYTTAAGSDSLELSKLLQDCWYDTVTDVEPLVTSIIGTSINKLAFLEDDGSVVLVNEDLGIEEDGIWYSNDYHLKADGWCRHGYCKPKKNEPVKQVVVKDTKELPSRGSLTNVFVYGTLKRGYSNHAYFLKDAVHLGKATTVLQWAMIGKDMSFPYVVEMDEVNGHRIHGEVYQVTPEELEKLDGLEGVSHGHYKKVPTNIQYSDDKTKSMVTMYVANRIPHGYATKEKIANWSR